MNPWLYAALCVTVPLAWGLGVNWVSQRIEKQLGLKAEKTQTIAQDDKV